MDSRAQVPQSPIDSAQAGQSAGKQVGEGCLLIVNYFFLYP